MKQTTRKNDLIGRVKEHNKRCMKVASMAFDYKCGEPNSQCVDTMIQGNLETGIEYCCLMREEGLDAIVDCLTGAVYKRSEVESIIDIMVDGKRRFNTFEFVE